MQVRGRRRSTVVLALWILPVVLLWAEEPTVYVTETGARYHQDGCSSLARSRIPMALSRAIAEGYTPCGNCRPPQPPAGPSTGPARRPLPSPSAAGPLYRVNVAGLERTREADLSRMIRARVVEHVDGDTVKVSVTDLPDLFHRVETIRFLGVDAPETVHPARRVEHFGRESSEYTRRRLLGKTVYLAFDWDLRDRYGRLLAYIYLPDGSCHNAQMIREGYAHAYTRFPFQFLEEFRALEREAREKKRGLWK